uniref:Secreted protein n=1 Tax=Oryza rufipogon TaxID=4529 RepID=A0A0E0P182_ORYRU
MASRARQLKVILAVIMHVLTCSVVWPRQPRRDSWLSDSTRDNKIRCKVEGWYLNLFFFRATKAIRARTVGQMRHGLGAWEDPKQVNGPRRRAWGWEEKKAAQGRARKEQVQRAKGSPNPPLRMVSMVLTTLPRRTFSLCGTILIKRESEERKKLGLIQDSFNTRTYALDTIKFYIGRE